MQTQQPQQRIVSNEQYDLISFLYHSLESATKDDRYSQDAERAKDNELAQIYRNAAQDERKHAQQAKELLQTRLGSQIQH